MIPKLLFIAGVVLLFLIPSSIATTPAISNVYYTEYPTECYIHWETNITSSNRVNYSVNANLSGGTYTAWTNNTTEPHMDRRLAQCSKASHATAGGKNLRAGRRYLPDAQGVQSCGVSGLTAV